MLARSPKTGPLVLHIHLRQLPFCALCAAIATALLAAADAASITVADAPPIVPNSCQTRQLAAPTSANKSGFSAPASAAVMRARRDDKRIGASVQLRGGGHVWWSLSWDGGATWQEATSLKHYVVSDLESVTQQFRAALPAPASHIAHVFVRAVVKQNDGSEHELCSLAEAKPATDVVTAAFAALSPSTATTSRAGAPK